MATSELRGAFRHCVRHRQRCRCQWVRQLRPAAASDVRAAPLRKLP